MLQEKQVEQLEKVLTQVLIFIEEKQSSGELLVNDEETFFDRMKANEPGELIELDGFLGQLTI